MSGARGHDPAERHRTVGGALEAADGQPCEPHLHVRPAVVWCVRCSGVWPCGCPRAAEPAVLYCQRCGHAAGHPLHLDQR